ncbi:MAG: flagellar hook-basal body complex protein FliE [Opitutaceae bacterium]|nr:flagellar hook-basal body complex protein FliE [Verrucomicrobiales bacterium]
MASPALRGLPGSAAAGEAAASKAIPASELAGLSGPQSAAPVGRTEGTFENVLGHLVGEVNDKQLAASQSVNGLLSGQNVSLHQAMISMEEASVSFQLMVEVRNKLLESYQELMRMQI